MKLSKETLEILKNFAAINQNLVIKPGSKFSTMNSTKLIMAEYEGSDVFDTQVSVFNLSEFLAAYASFTEPELILEEKYLTIKQGRQQVKFIYTDETLLITPKKEITMPSAEIKVTIPHELITRLLKMSSILSADDLAIIGDGKTVSVKIFNKKNPSANDFMVDLDVETTENFQVNFKVENLRLFPSDYDVEISKQKISKWSATSIKLVVYIAVEVDSKFQ